MFYDEFITDKAECDLAEHRAHYDSETLTITYYLPFMMEGYVDIMDTVVHEWIHGLIDWGLLGPNGEYTPEWLHRNKYDPTGEGDHFIMRVMNFD